MEIIFILGFWAFMFWLCWKWFLGGLVGKLSAAKYVKARMAAREIPDEAYFEMAGEEVARGTIRKGLWVQAMSESLGDEKKAGAIYIRLRVQAMRQETAAAIRQATDGNFSADKFKSVEQVFPMPKIVISCPRCSGRLRVEPSKHLDITCPHCRAEFRTQT